MTRRSEEETVGLNWKAPPEWNRFLDTVAAENRGIMHPYAGIEIECSWNEYREEHPIEEYANQLLAAVGTRDSRTREKIPLTRDASGGDEGRATVRVCCEVKQEMKAFAAEKGVPPHEILRAVVCWYLDGGLLGRITHKLQTVVPEVEKLGAEDITGDQLDLKERRTRAICNALKDDDGTYPPSFTMKEYADAVETGPQGLSDGYGDPATQKYRPRVLDRLNYVEHPNASGVYIPVEQAKEYAEEQGIDRDAPAIDRKPYADLTDEDRIHGLRVELARRAAERTNRKVAFRADTVCAEVFNGTPGVRKVRNLMDHAAADASGFETDAKDGAKRLRCDLKAVVDADVLTHAGLDAELIVEDAGETDSPSTVDTDGTRDSDREAEMDRILAATPAPENEGAE